MSERFPFPWFFIALDGLGTLLLVAGLLGALEVDVGLPILGRIWQFLVILGLALMAPLIVSVALAAKRKGR